MYTLGRGGTIQNWLACGPDVRPIDHLPALVPSDGPALGKNRRWLLNYWAYDPRVIRLKQDLFDHTNLLNWTPRQRPIVNGPAIHDHRWRYAVTEADEAIDFSRFNFTPSVMRAWIYTGLTVDENCTIDAELLTIAPAHIWVNGELQCQFDQTFSYVRTLYVPTRISLKAGYNEVYVHGLMFGWREARLALGLRLHSDRDIKVSVPLGDVDEEAWMTAESTLNYIHIDRFAYTDLPGSLILDANAPQGIDLLAQVTIPNTGSIQAEPLVSGTIRLEPGQRAELPYNKGVARALTALSGETTLTLSLRPADGTPIVLSRHAWLSANTFSSIPYGTYESRRREVLDHLSGMSHDVCAAMAAVATGKTQWIESTAVAVACEYMENRLDCADFYAVSLLALLYWYEGNVKPEDKCRIEKAFMEFKFWIDEPGLDAMCYFTENHQILFHVSAYLAGQCWPDTVFANSGLTGQQQTQRAHRRIRNWIRRRLKGGYSEWDSNAYMALDIFAMLALVEFADSSALREMAETLLHKSFFMLAMQSYRGAHGSTHGRCYVEGLKSARVENTSSLQRIAWGMGIFNGETRATSLLALAKRYKVPAIIQDIGGDTESPVATYSRSTATFRQNFDMRSDRWDVRTITRRTTDYMLSAAIDYFPGERGIQEHLWQATLSPEAVVFTNYPGNSQEHGHARPNFWAGSALLPRVAMHNRCVICLYQFEEKVGMGYSHAYFPTACFDEWVLDDQWVFARYGTGYIALWGDGELILTRQGRHTQQELRSSGQSTAWLCCVGSQIEDGRFAEFQTRVQNHTPTQNNSVIRWTTRDDDTISFAWDTPFMVNGQVVDWDNFPHYRNRYTDTAIEDNTMTIRAGNQSLVLDLAKGRLVKS